MRRHPSVHSKDAHITAIGPDKMTVDDFWQKQFDQAGLFRRCNAEPVGEIVQLVLCSARGRPSKHHQQKENTENRGHKKIS